MKHQAKSWRKLAKHGQAWNMLRTMVTQLITHERIKTTVAKAKDLRRVADRVVTLAKQGTIAGRRRARALLRTDEAEQKLFYTLAARYKDRAGGFTRVLQTDQRRSDSAKMAFIEFVDREGEMRPARPAKGLGLSWASKEFVNMQWTLRSTENKAEKTVSQVAEVADMTGMA